MRPSGRCVFGMRVFDCGVRVESDSNEMSDALNRFLLPPFPRINVLPDGKETSVAVLSIPNGFEIFLDERKVSEAQTVEDAALSTVKALDDALIRKFRDLRAVHAGAVVFDGRAVMIPGSSHAGKSSLVAELLRRGGEHLSDEYALIDAQGRVHAYPRPLLLRNGGPKQSLVLPEDLNATFARKSVTVGWIVAVKYDPDATWEVQQVSQGEAVMLLLQNTPHEMSESPEMIDLFTLCAANAGCYVGKRGEVSNAADRILELVSGK